MSFGRWWTGFYSPHEGFCQYTTLHSRLFNPKFPGLRACDVLMKYCDSGMQPIRRFPDRRCMGGSDSPFLLIISPAIRQSEAVAAGLPEYR